MDLTIHHIHWRRFYRPHYLKRALFALRSRSKFSGIRV